MRLKYYYIFGFDSRTDSFSYPVDRVTNIDAAISTAKVHGPSFKVATAKEYKELTGRDAARDLNRDYDVRPI